MKHSVATDSTSFPHARRPTDRGDVRLLSDEPISDPASDYFGFAAFATALAEIIDNESTDTPLTIALSAPWGAGKTSVAGMIQSLMRDWVAERDGDRPRIVCWFNAWEHDDAPHLGAALSAKVARTASARRRPWWRLLQPLPKAMLGPQERWRRALILGVTTVAVAILLTAIATTRHAAEELLHLKAAVVGGLGWLGLILVATVVWRGVFSAARDAARFVDDPKSEAARGSMAQVKAQLGQLIRRATRRGRMVIFVDDLERCRAARAVEIFEVAGQLLAHPGVVTVLLADMDALSAAAQQTYAGDDASPDLGRRYLEKLVQLELELPPPSENDMRRLLRGDTPDIGTSETKPNGATAALVATRVSLKEVQAGAVLVGGIAALGTLSAVLIEGGGGLTGSAGVTAGATGAALAGVFTAVVGAWRARFRRQRREVEEEIAARFDEGDNSEATATDDGPEDSHKSLSDRLESYADKVVESIRTVRSPEIEAVEQFIQHYPPRFPRGAKRMLNHARLLTKIAREREMFGGSPALTSQHLGKWIVLCERWPRLAGEIAAQFTAIEKGLEFEAWMTQTMGEDWVQREPELERLLREPPQLAGLIGRLVYFRPAAGAPESENLRPPAALGK